jgi:hypothetical protein
VQRRRLTARLRRLCDTVSQSLALAALLGWAAGVSAVSRPGPVGRWRARHRLCVQLMRST